MARKMKDSGIEWIGEIPEGWEIIPVKYLAKYNYDTLAESCSPDFEFSYIDIGSVTYTDGITNYQNFKFKDAPSRARRIVHSGDILVSTVRTYLRAVACVNEHRLPQIASTGFLVLQADISKIHPHFLMYSVLSDNFICKVEANSVGISYPAINASQIVHFKLPIPQLSEQFLLVTYLDRQCSNIDTILSKTRSSIEEYKKLKQTVITQAVTKGVRGEREMKDSGVEWIGEIPTTYSICKLKYLLKNPLKYGANESGIPYSDSLPRYIRITDITPDGNLKCTGKLSLSEESAKDYILEDGDILFARSGATVGKTFIYYQSYGRSAYAGYLIKASLNNKVSPKFVYYYTCSSLYEIWKNSIFIQSTIQNIGADRYANLPVPVPKTLQEQEEIADYLDAKCAKIDKLIAKKEQLAKELESYKKSLIYEVVTGKREV